MRVYPVAEWMRRRDFNFDLKRDMDGYLRDKKMDNGGCTSTFRDVDDKVIGNKDIYSEK